MKAKAKPELQPQKLKSSEQQRSALGWTIGRHIERTESNIY
jgi:hypothetical protein